MRVVINADDLGLHPAVERAVYDLAGAGVLTSVSVLANGPYLPGADRLKSLGVGVHLNVLRGAPISPVNEVRSLLGGNRFLCELKPFLFRYLTGRINPAEVELEWSRQIESLLDKGFVPEHLDSEKHLHCLPQLNRVAIRLARRYGIKWVRRPVQIPLKKGIGSASHKAWLIGLVASRAEPVDGVRFADSVWGIANPGKNLRSESFAADMRHLPPEAVVEIICHPGKGERSDPGIPGAFGRMKAPEVWENEYEALLNPGWTDLTKEKNFRFCSFGQIT